MSKLLEFVQGKPLRTFFHKLKRMRRFSFLSGKTSFTLITFQMRLLPAPGWTLTDDGKNYTEKVLNFLSGQLPNYVGWHLWTSFTSQEITIRCSRIVPSRRSPMLMQRLMALQWTFPRNPESIVVLAEGWSDSVMAKKERESNKSCRSNSRRCGEKPAFENFISETCIMKKSGKVEELSSVESRPLHQQTHGTTTKDL